MTASLHKVRGQPWHPSAVDGARRGKVDPSQRGPADEGPGSKNPTERIGPFQLEYWGTLRTQTKCESWGGGGGGGCKYFTYGVHTVMHTHD